MATMTVTISGLTDNDIDYSPSDRIIKPDDTVTFTKQNLDNYDVTISWDSSCPVTSSAQIDLDGSTFQPVNRTVSTSASDGLYNFTVSFQLITPPGTEEEPEEQPTHGGLEVSREN